MTTIEAQPLMSDDDLRWMWKLEQAEFEELFSHFPPLEQAALVERFEAMAPPPEPWEALPHQVPPSIAEHWYGWLLLGGRGMGKTAAITHWMNDHALGPPCLPGKVPHRMGIIAPTLGDASASIVHGDDGLTVINPEVREVTRKGGTVALWPNGSYAFLLGVNTENDVNRLRAHGNRCADIREEIAAWRYLKDGMDQADLGLRKGLARWVGATTPKPRNTIRRLNNDPIVRISTATTNDNPHLSEEKRAQLYEMFGNTTLGIQELDGKILDEVSGALWSQELIEQYRVSADEVPRLIRVRTYVDPSWGTTNDECGIIVCGLGANRHVYVLADLSKRTTPSEWGMLAALGRIPSKDELEARDDDGRLVPIPMREYFGRVSEAIVAEKNFQGEQVRLVMKTTEMTIRRRIKFALINASQGKRLRAEPVHALYEKGRVHHVGRFEGLEFQQTNWVPPEAGEDAGDPGDPVEQEGAEGIDPSKWSPDRLDAVVYGVTDLLLGKGSGVGKMEVSDGRLPKQQITSGPQQRAPLGSLPPSTRQRRIVEQQLGPKTR